MSTSGASPRQALVDTARKAWIARLIDLSRRNNLLYFRTLKAGTLDLAPAPAEVMAELLCGDLVTLRRLLPEATDEVMKQRTGNLLGIWRQAVGNLEERGLDTLYLALGGATWPAADEGRPAAAPVFLIPLTIELRGRDGANVALRRAGDVQVNAVLLHVLETEHRIVFDPEQLIEVLEGDDAGELFNLQPAFARLKGFCARVHGFDVGPLQVVGNFSFQKMAIVRDLEEQGPSLASHQLIAALCGDADARQAISSARRDVDPASLDARPADDEFMVLDADSSQQTVVVSALQGQDGVIQGPPGTGKSQTIANLIAELAARGKRVLFVAEKRAALEVVKDRLGRAGLGHLVLDLHGADISRRQLMANIASTLQVIGDSRPPDTDAVHRPFEATRQRLIEHLRQLHGTRTEAGVSVFDLQAMLLRLPPDVASQTRWRGAALGPLSLEARKQAESLLGEAATTAPLFLGEAPSLWNGATLDDGHRAQEAIDVATRLANVRLPALVAAATRLATAGGLPPARTHAEVERQVELTEAVAALDQSYPGLFGEKLDEMTTTLAPAASTFARLWAMLTSGAFRAAQARVKSLTRGARTPAQMLMDVSEAQRLAAAWRGLAPGSAPRTLAEAAELRRVLGEWRTDQTALSAVVSRRWPDELTQLQADYASLAGDRITPLRIPRLRALDHELQAGGWAALVSEIRARKPEPAGWATLLQHAWATSHLEKAWADNPSLATFDGQAHGSVVDRFRELDRQRVRIAVERVRRAHGLAAVRIMNERPEQAALVKRESQKKTRHLPFRTLVKEAGPVLTALKPCWMASPLSVSQLLPPSQGLFDIVLFDEASQVLPEDSVTSLLRARNAVVAGDRHQLPPTTFFASGEDDLSGDSEERTATEGFESLLDLMSAFCPPWSLDWHYRSRDESLIAFSNRHIYDSRLVTFPSPGGAHVMRHELVTASPADGEEDSSAAEIERVVELVLEHARARPGETLGVIAMGIKHAARLQAALDDTLRTHPELDGYFDQNRPERFFIKNLERVQGDERDAIILTIGYGKDKSGKLPYRFGPLLYEGGERRLNVAITRARYRLTLVSSFSHLDMDPARTRNRGVELLRLYLEYAASEGGASKVSASDLEFTPLEEDVQQALTARGIPLSPQWGASRFRIDLVAKHPTDPERHVLAVECDGAAYEAAPTVRDRDRLRQQHLEGLGWRFHRIWSTDWYLHKQQEIERAWTAYQAAVAWSDQALEAAKAAAAATPVAVAAAPVPAPVEAPPAPVAPVDPRGAGPQIKRRQSIADYKPFELAEVVRWVASDGRLRTDDEWVEEAADQLGFRRIGPRIDATLRKTIAMVREEK